MFDFIKNTIENWKFAKKLKTVPLEIKDLFEKELIKFEASAKLTATQKIQILTTIFINASAKLEAETEIIKNKIQQIAAENESRIKKVEEDAKTIFANGMLQATKIENAIEIKIAETKPIISEELKKAENLLTNFAKATTKLYKTFEEWQKDNQ